MHSPKLCLRLPKTLMLSSLSTCSLFVFSSFCWHYNSFTKSCKDSIISFLDFWVTSLSLSLFSYANSTLGGEGQLTKFSKQENKLIFFTLATQGSNFQKNLHSFSHKLPQRGGCGKVSKSFQEGIFKVSLGGKWSVQRHFRSEDSIHFWQRWGHVTIQYNTTKALENSRYWAETWEKNPSDLR